MESKPAKVLSRTSTLDWVLEGTIGEELVFLPFPHVHSLEQYVDDCSWFSEQYGFKIVLDVYHKNIFQTTLEYRPKVH